MDDMINRHDSIAEENIEPNGRPATNEFEEWSDEVSDRADNVFKKDKKEGPVKAVSYTHLDYIFLTVFIFGI